MEKRRICVFCETWASGGIESFLTSILLRQDMSDMEIDLAAAEQCDSVYTAALMAHGVRFVTLSGSSQRVFENWKSFRRLLAERGYETVYVNAFQALSLRYGLLARRAGVPVRILHSHGADIRAQALRPLKLLVHRIARALYGGVGTDYFACSDEAAAFMFPTGGRGKHAVRFLPNGIETRRFAFQAEGRERVRSRLGLREDLVLGYIGRLSNEKNPLFLLDVLHALLPMHPEARLLLAGDGRLREAMEDRAARLKLRDRVLFCGVTDKPQELYWAMDVFLFPSLSEALGIAAVEAQCTGLPLLCSEHIPAQALMTDLARRVPLSGGADAWARAASSIELPKDREKYASAVRAAGFDAVDTAHVLRGALMGEAPDNGKDDG